MTCSSDETMHTLPRHIGGAAAAHAGMCLDIAAALAVCIPGRILTELAATDLLQPGQGAMLPPTLLEPHMPSAAAFSQSMPSLQRLTACYEERVGSFPVTLAFLHLTSSLLDGGLADDTLQAGHKTCLKYHQRPNGNLSDIPADFDAGNIVYTRSAMDAVCTRPVWPLFALGFRGAFEGAPNAETPHH